MTEARDETGGEPVVPPQPDQSGITLAEPSATELIPQPQPASEETVTAVRAAPLDEKTLQLATRSRVRLNGASSKFLSLVEDMAGSKTGLGLRSTSGVLFEISRIDKDSPTRGDIFARCNRPVIADGSSLPEPFDNLSICLDIDARATQIDLDDEEECSCDYAEWKCYEALANNPNLNGRIVNGAYTWRDKQFHISAYIIQKLFFWVNPDGLNLKTYRTKRFNPVTVTTGEIDFELAKLFNVSPLPEEAPPPEETPPTEPGACKIITEPVSEIATNSLNKPKFVKGKYGTIAYGTDKGVNYKDCNEDAVVVDSKNGFAVVDGMGGLGRAEDAAGILAVELRSGLKRLKTFDDIHMRAHKRMSKERVESGGACYIGARIKDGWLNVGQAGDVKLMVIDAGGIIKFETKNQGSGDIVSNAVMGDERHQGTTELSDTKLAVGDRIVTGTDGLFDNIPPEEVATLIHGKTIQEAIQILNLKAKERMQSAKERISQGLPAKPDNISVVIYDIENLE